MRGSPGKGPRLTRALRFALAGVLCWAVLIGAALLLIQIKDSEAAAAREPLASPAVHLTPRMQYMWEHFPRFHDAIPILAYHGVNSEENYLSVTRKRFAQQLLALKTAGFHTLSMAQYAHYAATGETAGLPPNPILITFDDGRLDSYRGADRTLARFGYTAVMFVVASFPEGRPGWAVHWSELAQMEESGRWDIQEHAGTGHRHIQVDAAGKHGEYYAYRRWREGGLESFAEYKRRVTRDVNGAGKCWPATSRAITAGLRRAIFELRSALHQRPADRPYFFQFLARAFPVVIDGDYLDEGKDRPSRDQGPRRARDQLSDHPGSGRQPARVRLPAARLRPAGPALARVRLSPAQHRPERDPIRLLRVGIAAAAGLAVILFAVAFLVGFDGGGEARPPKTRQRPPGHLSWVISGDDLGALRAGNAGLARRFFDNNETFVIGSPEDQDAVPRGYRSIPTLLYPSLREFEADIHRGSIDPRIAAVIYDPEDWAQTPAAERNSPLAAMHRFTRLATRWGYGPILAPGRDLALAGHGCAKREGEHLDQAYLRCGLPSGAEGAEMFVVQAAPVELSLDHLHALLRGARRQLRRHSPRSTGPGQPQHRTTGGGKRRLADRPGPDAHLELKHFSGIVLNFPAADTDLAASFLRDLEKEGPVDGRLVSRRG